ncbi:MAG: phosphoribosylamine--glycine ligase [Planctomycetes bacterium]|nr:phosphoribosylamine--glycine ligase [Planctomycetota bacterium]
MNRRKKVLVVGGGGREHAIVSTLARGASAVDVYCAPGNGGIRREARAVDIGCDTPDDIERLASFARRESIDLTVVGPEAPLVLGIADRFEAEGLRIFGPPAAGARLEGSKCFLKEFLARRSIPTAEFRIFDRAEDALTHVETCPVPVVVKADGLAAGKGVIVARERREAVLAVEAIMVERRFGEAGRRIVVEECLAGSEVSLLVVTDGRSYIPLETAQDYKPAFDGGKGPNTGGMGSYSPYLSLGSPLVQQALERIIAPTIEGLRDEGIPFRGVLYAGLMLTSDGPKILEYNVRFGDPETQPILMRLGTDLLSLLEAAASEGGLERFTLEWDPRSAVCVVLASGGYPGSYEKGLAITGLEEAEQVAAPGEVKVFHAGTAAGAQGEIVTSGGRVLGVTALGETQEVARRRAYEAVAKIGFAGMRCRTDIAARS